MATLQRHDSVLGEIAVRAARQQRAKLRQMRKVAGHEQVPRFVDQAVPQPVRRITRL